MHLLCWTYPPHRDKLSWPGWHIPTTQRQTVLTRLTHTHHTETNCLDQADTYPPHIDKLSWPGWHTTIYVTDRPSDTVWPGSLAAAIVTHENLDMKPSQSAFNTRNEEADSTELFYLCGICMQLAVRQQSRELRHTEQRWARKHTCSKPVLLSSSWRLLIAFLAAEIPDLLLQTDGDLLASSVVHLGYKRSSVTTLIWQQWMFNDKISK